MFIYEVTVQQYLVVHKVKFLDQWLQLFLGGGTRDKSKEKKKLVFDIITPIYFTHAY
jgi:hypothetical protein